LLEPHPAARVFVNHVGVQIEEINMSTRSTTIAATIALAVIFSLSPATADTGAVRLTIAKAGFIVGGSSGDGELYFRGRVYPLSAAGVDFGLVFGAAEADLRGHVTNIQRPSDVVGSYTAAGAGLAVGGGVRAITLTNDKGAVLELSGPQVGLLANVDLSGLTITID
jgi:hypothetical protein